MRRIACITLFLVAGHGSALAAQEPAGHTGEHAASPTEGLRAEWIQDVDGLEEKFMGLAEGLKAHWAWRPAEGVRSVGEVFGHLANANFMFPGMVGVVPEMEPEDFEKMEDPEAVLEGLRHSFMHARHAIAEIPDEELDGTVDLWGNEATRRQVLSMMVTHMHEHLGQSIAYARMNGVVPPWSAGGS